VTRNQKKNDLEIFCRSDKEGAVFQTEYYRKPDIGYEKLPTTKSLCVLHNSICSVWVDFSY
jgi:hypothetical protein